MDRKQELQDEISKFVDAVKPPSNHLAVKKFCQQPICYILAVTLALVVIVPLLSARFTPTDNPQKTFCKTRSPGSPSAKSLIRPTAQAPPVM